MSKSKTVVAYLRRIVPPAQAALVQGVGLAGFAMCIEGIRRIYEPAALIVGGAMMVVWTILKVRSDT